VVQVLKKWFNKYFSDPQAVFLFLALIFGFAVVIYMGGMLLPVLASLVVAYLLDDVVELMEHKGVPRLRGVVLVFLVFIALMVVVLFALVPMLSAQGAELLQQLPKMVGKGRDALLQLPEHYPFISETQVTHIIEGVLSELTAIGQKMVSASVASLISLITLIVYLVLFPLLVFFFLKDKFIILKWAGNLLPSEHSIVIKVWKAVDKQIGNYVKGKLWEMLIVGLVSGLVFSVMGLDYSILLGALVGVSVIVPYIGATVVTIPVVLIAFFQWGWTAPFAYLVIAYTIIQALDASVLFPLLFSEAMNLHPIAIMVAILFFGGVWGGWGVFFAIPLATLVQAIINAWPRTEREAPDSA